MKATWADLDAELALWCAAGEVPTFWWRDDDAQAPTDALDRLIGLAEQVAAPLHLAVIPQGIDAGLRQRLEAAPMVYALQHGLSHTNHETKPLRASEVGISRDVGAIRADMRLGWQLLIDAALPRLLPVMVPPWGRIGEQVLAHLPDWGYPLLSCFSVRPNPEPVAGLRHINCHMDPLRWKNKIAQCAGTEKALGQVVEHLQQRRFGVAERDEPTGVVTHHLQTNAETWELMEALMDRLTYQGATRWIPLTEVLDG